MLRRLNDGRHHPVLFTDEKLFTIEGVVNKRNDRIYACSNAHLTVPRSAHLKSIMIFAGICYDGKMPLIFVFQGVKVNANSYLDLLNTHILHGVSNTLEGKSGFIKRMAHSLTGRRLFKISVILIFLTSSLITNGPPAYQIVIRWIILFRVY